MRLSSNVCQEFPDRFLPGRRPLAANAMLFFVQTGSPHHTNHYVMYGVAYSSRALDAQQCSPEWSVSTAGPTDPGVRHRFGFVLPTFRNPWLLSGRYIAIPLWLPWLLFAIPTAVLWSYGLRGAPKRSGQSVVGMRRNRASCIVISVFFGVLLLLILNMALFALGGSVWGQGSSGHSMLPEWAGDLILLSLGLSLPYAAARVLYARLRRRRVWQGDPHYYVPHPGVGGTVASDAVDRGETHDARREQ